MSDFPRLATSPLLGTALVPAEGTSLDRARALHALLVAAIDELRPPGADGFSAEAPYRHFNALYYPYVIGLRPYARNTVTGSNGSGSPDADTAHALTWLRNEVPERTLYNWQGAASRLIAGALWERMAGG